MEVKMVDRTVNEGLKQFEGTVSAVEFEPAKDKDSRNQYKISIKTSASKKSGFMYEWIGMSSTASDSAIPKDSNADRFLTELESCLPQAKSCKSFEEALNLMVNKKMLFTRKKLGRAFKGHEAKDFWIPTKVL